VAGDHPNGPPPSRHGPYGFRSDAAGVMENQ
jgi:hypothetical protein